MQTSIRSERKKERIDNIYPCSKLNGIRKGTINNNQKCVINFYECYNTLCGWRFRRVIHRKIILLWHSFEIFEPRVSHSRSLQKINGCLNLVSGTGLG